jgi:hypothetical protein
MHRVHAKCGQRVNLLCFHLLRSVHLLMQGQRTADKPARAQSGEWGRCPHPSNSLNLWPWEDGMHGVCDVGSVVRIAPPLRDPQSSLVVGAVHDRHATPPRLLVYAFTQHTRVWEARESPYTHAGENVHAL